MTLTYLIGGTTTFITVFVKGFQYKNVIGGHMKLVAITAYMMAFLDVFLIGLVSKTDWTIAFPCGAGAMFGMIASIKTHDKWFGKNGL